MSIKVRRAAIIIDTCQHSKSACSTWKTWKLMHLEEVTLRMSDRGQKAPLLCLVKSYCTIKMRSNHEANTSQLSLVAGCRGCHKCGPQHAHVKNVFFFPPGQMVPVSWVSSYHANLCSESVWLVFLLYKKKGFKHDRQLMKTTGWISMNFPMNIYKSIITSVTTGDVNLLFFRLFWDL